MSKREPLFSRAREEDVSVRDVYSLANAIQPALMIIWIGESYLEPNWATTTPIKVRRCKFVSVNTKKHHIYGNGYTYEFVWNSSYQWVYRPATKTDLARVAEILLSLESDR